MSSSLRQPNAEERRALACLRLLVDAGHGLQPSTAQALAAEHRERLYALRQQRGEALAAEARSALRSGDNAAARELAAEAARLAPAAVSACEALHAAKARGVAVRHTATFGSGRLSLPLGLSCDTDGSHLAVCDVGLGAVVVFDASGTFVQALATGFANPRDAHPARSGGVLVLDSAAKTVCALSSTLESYRTRPVDEAPGMVPLRARSCGATTLVMHADLDAGGAVWIPIEGGAPVASLPAPALPTDFAIDGRELLVTLRQAGGILRLGDGKEPQCVVCAEDGADFMGICRHADGFAAVTEEELHLLAADGRPIATQRLAGIVGSASVRASAIAANGSRLYVADALCGVIHVLELEVLNG